MKIARPKTEQSKEAVEQRVKGEEPYISHQNDAHLPRRRRFACSPPLAKQAIGGEKQWSRQPGRQRWSRCGITVNCSGLLEPRRSARKLEKAETKRSIVPGRWDTSAKSPPHLRPLTNANKLSRIVLRDANPSLIHRFGERLLGSTSAP